MPSNVLLFERLMYVSLCIGLVIFTLDGSRIAAKPEVEQMGGMGFVAGTAIASLAVFVFFIWLIARKGKNWARWVFAALFAIGLITSYQGLSELLANNPLAAMFSVSQYVIQGFATYLLFSGDAPPWFEKPAAVA